MTNDFKILHPDAGDLLTIWPTLSSLILNFASECSKNWSSLLNVKFTTLSQGKLKRLYFIDTVISFSFTAHILVCIVLHYTFLKYAERKLLMTYFVYLHFTDETNLVALMILSHILGGGSKSQIKGQKRISTPISAKQSAFFFLEFQRVRMKP